MKKSEQKEPKLRQESLFPPSLFGIYLGVLLLMAGIHTGLIVLENRAGWNEIVQTALCRFLLCEDCTNGQANQYQNDTAYSNLSCIRTCHEQLVQQNIQTGNEGHLR